MRYANTPRSHIVGGLLLIVCAAIFAGLGFATPAIAYGLGYSGSTGLDWTTVVMVAAVVVAIIVAVVGITDLIIGVIAAGVKAGATDRPHYQ